MFGARPSAWGRKMMKPGDTLDAFILETAAIFQNKYTLFARAERVRRTNYSISRLRPFKQ